MFCHGCVRRYQIAWLIAFKIAHATVAAWLAGDIEAAYVNAARFTYFWNRLNEIGETA